MSARRCQVVPGFENLALVADAEPGTGEELRLPLLVDVFAAVRHGRLPLCLAPPICYASANMIAVA
jgi:hypothetical protein